MTLVDKKELLFVIKDYIKFFEIDELQYILNNAKSISVEKRSNTDIFIEFDNEIELQLYDNASGKIWLYDCARQSFNDWPQVNVTGDKYWWSGHTLHRDNDLPAVILSSGCYEWRQNNKLHRNQGPAVINNFKYRYYINGHLKGELFR